MDAGLDYESHDAVSLAALVRAGEATPQELLEAAIERADRHAGLGAVVIPMYDAGREAAAGDLPDGPLRGVPYLLKDLHAARVGWKLTNGSRLFEAQVSDHDSELVRRYERAGLVLFGRSASPEFGITTSSESELYGATRNPWNLAHSAGGSSGGAAAAVAAGIVPAAHASDGGGSIRIPASCCGLFGMKPTRARTPSGPAQGEGWSGMSISHAVTRSVRDSAVLLDATEGDEPGAPYAAPPLARPLADEVGADPGRLRIALQVETFNGAPTHPDCAVAAREAAALCASLGHEVVEARLEVDREAFGAATQVIIAASTRIAVEDRAAALGREPCDGDVEPLTWGMVQLVGQRSAVDYARAVRAVHAAGRVVSRFLAGYDVLLTPTLATPPAELGELALTNPDGAALMARLMQTIGYTQLFNGSGNPAMSVPLHWSDAGLPIGVQFAGRFGDEATLFRLAAQLERARPWFERRPPQPG
jgi:amidase/6-aminohexanoate-cyclic-dimer hydrolase